MRKSLQNTCYGGNQIPKVDKREVQKSKLFKEELCNLIAFRA
jgi:hypothetical protein